AIRGERGAVDLREESQRLELLHHAAPLALGLRVEVRGAGRGLRLRLRLVRRERALAGIAAQDLEVRRGRLPASHGSSSGRSTSRAYLRTPLRLMDYPLYQFCDIAR